MARVAQNDVEWRHPLYSGRLNISRNRGCEACRLSIGQRRTTLGSAHRCRNNRPPITYQIDQEQYVAVLAGWGGAAGLILTDNENSLGKGRLLVFKLGGRESLPESVPDTYFPRPPREEAIATQLVEVQPSMNNTANVATARHLVLKT